MTLLEAVLATVLLALVAVACLDGTGQAARLQARSVEAAGTVARAEAALEAARLDLPPSPATQVTRRAYGDPASGATPSLDLVTVEVTDPEGRRLQLSRLVPRATAIPGDRSPARAGQRP